MHTIDAKPAARRQTQTRRRVIFVAIVSLAVGAHLGTIGTDRAVAAVARGTPSGSASGPQQEQISAIKGIGQLLGGHAPGPTQIA